MIEIALSKASSSLKILCEYREIVNYQTKQETAVSNYPQGRNVMAVSPTGFRKSMIFPCFTVCTQQTKMVIVINLLKSNFWKIIAELHSNWIVVRSFFALLLFEDSDPVTKRSLAIEVKLWSVIFHAQEWHTRPDDTSDLSISTPISDFWNPLRLEALKKILHVHVQIA